MRHLPWKTTVLAAFLLAAACAPVKKTVGLPDRIMGKIAVNHTNLYCEKAGRGVPVVFIHGFSLDTRMWDEQWAVFARAYTVVRYDLRGFGRSDLPVEEEPYTHHDDLVALLDALKIEKAVIVGLSLGGRVATSFALSYPDRVLGLALVDSVLEGYAMKDYPMAHVYEAAREDGIPRALELWLDHPTFEASRQNKAVAFQLQEMVNSYSGWHFVHKNPLTPLNPPCIDRLQAINIPTLILIGALDLTDFQEISGILHQNIPGSGYHKIPDAGHMCNMENPTAFNEALTAWLKGLPKPEN